MLRILLLAPLGLAMSTVAEKRTLNMTDVSAARSKHDAVVKDAREAFAALSKTTQGLKTRAALVRNHTELANMVDMFYTQAGRNASTNAILHSVEDAREKEKKELQGVASHAKTSARAVLHTARNVEHVSRKTGVSERIFEKEYGDAEHFGEHLQDKVGDLSEDASEALSDIYTSVEAPIKEKLHREEKAKHEAEKKAKEAEKKAKEVEKKAKEAAERAAERKEEAAERAAERKEEAAEGAAERKERAAERAAERKKSNKTGSFLGQNHTALETDKSQQLAAFSAPSFDNVAMLGCVGFLSLLAMVLYSQLRRTQPVISTYPILG
jgi:hypothetical protein